MAQDRYPGAQPFQENQEALFFGRREETLELYQLIRQEPLVVLYAKSGLGKSSLLNAGLIPLARRDNAFLPVPIRFLAYTGAEQWPAETAAGHIRSQTAAGGPDFLVQLIAEDDSLWRRLKEQQLAAPPGQGILLIFDQFEELFTYPPEARLQFRRQLAEALYTALPQRYWDMLGLYGPGESPLNAEQLARLQEPLNLRAVFSIRQDRMHLLGNLADYLPSISKSWYELKALGRNSARNAIVLPASAGGDFSSPPFTYTPEALDEMLDFLSEKGQEDIESTQLQIVCNAIEQRVARQGLAEVDKNTLGSLDQIIEDYYGRKIGAIEDPEQRLAARRLIEEGLIFEEEERRLSLYEGQALQDYGLHPETLRLLVDSHLLRAEPSLRGGYTYELSHDTLVPPILKAYAERRETDRRREEEEERQRQGRLLEAERSKRRRARRVAGIMFILFVIAMATAGWAIHANAKAGKALEKFQEEEKKRRELEISELFETAIFFREAGYTDDARIILDSISRMDTTILTQDSVLKLKEKWKE